MGSLETAQGGGGRFRGPGSAGVSLGGIVRPGLVNPFTRLLSAAALPGENRQRQLRLVGPSGSLYQQQAAPASKYPGERKG